MKLKKMVIVAALTIPTLTACGKADSQSSAVKGDDSSKDKKTVFNLAEYLQTSGYEDLEGYVKTGDVVFGDMNKIGVRSNVNVETYGSSKLTPNGRGNISGRFFLNGTVYPRGVKLPDGTLISRGGAVLQNGKVIDNIFSNLPADGSKISDKQADNLEYSIVDVEAKAGVDVTGVEGHFRFLGDDKLAFSKKPEYKFSQTRALELNYPVFPGGILKASLGGEMGFFAQMVERKDGAISLLFKPNMAIQSSVEGKAHIFIASAGAEAVLTLIEAVINTSASVRYLVSENFAYGDISMDSSAIKALDGEVFVFVKMGFNELLKNVLGTFLPVDSLKIWLKISDFLGFDFDKKWKYTVWDPEPVFTTKIPARGVFFTSDTSGMSSEECKSVRDEVYLAGDVMEKAKKAASGDDAVARAQTAQANLAKTALYLNSNCGK